jgi:signal transduction histidine kinase
MTNDLRDTCLVLVDEMHGALGRLAMALELVRDAFAWIDATGRIIWCNPAFDDLAQCDHLLLLGAPIAEMLNLRRDGIPVTGAAHPAQRVLADTAEVDEVYEVERDGTATVVEVFGRRGMGMIDAGPTAVVVVRDVTDTVRAQSDLKSLNARLEATNAEIEAFSYSVSHDLRTPLRAIDGFSQALLEDYSRVLPAEGRDYLQRLRFAAQKMGQLIEDLLRLSRVTRADLEWTAVDLSAICRSVGAELAAGAPEHPVELVVEDGMTTSGDVHWLHLAIENLLSNAWKFTGKTRGARIEVGTTTDDRADKTFFVRDNGAGFEMARADKLFAAFQRLHTGAEFPGIGIGLAIVRRIIHRHGGRIWATAEVGKGATFYFTLPGSSSNVP